MKVFFDLNIKIIMYFLPKKIKIIQCIANKKIEKKKTKESERKYIHVNNKI
jgi:hypothetical protein